MRILLVVFLSTLLFSAHAQILRVTSSPLLIKSQVPGYSELKTINTKTLAYSPKLSKAKNQPVIDGDPNTEINKIDHYADILPVSITMADGTISSTSAGKAWALRISITNATNLGLIFNTFKLSPKAEMYVFNDEKTELDSCIKQDNFTRSSTLAISPLKGNTVILYIIEPLSTADFQSSISINKIEAGFKDTPVATSAVTSREASTNCNPTIACSPYMMPSARAVAKIISNGYMGTGTLINNELNNGKAYFLTAFHVIDADENNVLDPSEINALANSRMIFQYWRNNCNSSVNDMGITFYGATLKAASKETDIVLLELSNPPGVGDGVNYAGWNRQTTPPADYSSYILHHPNGEDMRITSTRDVADWLWGSKFWTAHYNQGVVSPGSSGAGLFNQYGQVVGQLRGGWSSCDFTDFGDRYGKFYYSWTEAGLQPLLSPSGVQAVNPLILSTITMNGDENIDYCDNGNHTYSVPNLVGCTYSWNVPGTLNLLSGQNTSSITVNRNTAVLPAYTQLSVTITDSKGYSRTQTVNKTIQVGVANITLASGPPPPAPRYVTVMFKYNNTYPGSYFDVESADGNPFIPLNTLNPATNLQNVTGVSFDTNYGMYRTITVRYTNTCGVSAWQHFGINLDDYPHLPTSAAFKVYPNPVSTTLFIEPATITEDITPTTSFSPLVTVEPRQASLTVNTKASQGFSAVLLDIKSKVVARHPFSKEKVTLNINNIPNGTYFLHITKDGKTSKQQIIISH
ncbi:trypsin-like peptidase domain-containing protein [Pedobacter soli]|uniref:Por secretion system C-terminal sorting domain-containing protein n=1 Tax=Pedobacter soli TaxID=390242 RepID=A0A1G6ZE56_9SPHI|nr:trypsin-like peptidase domain-containing protein [Pedobacter soli]SDE00583.1 Por secretion system C-terminal sorting domain-containing protein [Pedobacter soli]